MYRRKKRDRVIILNLATVKGSNAESFLEEKLLALLDIGLYSCHFLLFLELLFYYHF